MRFESYVVAEILQRLEQQSAALRPHTVQIATALSKDDYAKALEASAELHRVLARFVATTGMLQDHVVAHDGLGEPGEAVGELALRARTMVLVAQLASLGEALGRPALQSRTREWFAGRFQRFGELSTFVLARVAQAHALWKPYRQDQRQQLGMTESDRVNMYRMMIGVAERALLMLQDEPEFAQFLQGGLAATDLPEIHLACKQIVAVLGLRISEHGQHSRRASRASANGDAGNGM